MTVRLNVPSTDRAHCRLPKDRDIAAWHHLLTQTIAETLSPAHAGLFARPVAGPAGAEWEAEGSAAIAFVDLAPAEQSRLASVIGSILSDIRRLVGSGLAPTLVPLWPMIGQVPDAGHVFLVSGRPVLAAWGHHDGRGGFFVGIDDGLAGVTPAMAPIPAARRRPSYTLLLGLLALVALAAGAAGAFCRGGPGQFAAFADLRKTQLQGQNLQTMLAQLVEETGQRQLQCARLQPPAPPGLSQTQWDRQDISVMKGCWNRYTNMTVVHLADNKVLAVQSWRMCFDDKGAGTQTIQLTDGDSCTGPLAAHFDGSKLVINEPAICDGTMSMVHGNTTCERDSADEASCVQRDDVGPTAGQPSNSHFRR